LSAAQPKGDAQVVLLWTREALEPIEQWRAQLLK
jgi:hypothetical protein